MAGAAAAPTRRNVPTEVRDVLEVVDQLGTHALEVVRPVVMAQQDRDIAHVRKRGDGLGPGAVEYEGRDDQVDPWAEASHGSLVPGAVEREGKVVAGPLPLGLQAEHLLSLPGPQEARHPITDALVRGQDHKVVGAVALVPEREVGPDQLDGLLHRRIHVRALDAIGCARLVKGEGTPEPVRLSATKPGRQARSEVCSAFCPEGGAQVQV